MSIERVLTTKQLGEVFDLLLKEGKAHSLESLGEFGERFEAARNVMVNAPLKTGITFNVREGRYKVIYPFKDVGLKLYQVIFLYNSSHQLLDTEIRAAVFFKGGGLDSAQAIVLEEQSDEGMTSWTIMGAEMISGKVEPIRESRLLPLFADSLEAYKDLFTQGAMPMI